MKGSVRNELRSPEAARRVTADLLEVWERSPHALLVAPVLRREAVYAELCVRRSELYDDLAPVYLGRRAKVSLDFEHPRFMKGVLRCRVVRLDRLEADLLRGMHLQDIEQLEKVLVRVRATQTARTLISGEWVSL